METGFIQVFRLRDSSDMAIAARGSCSATKKLCIDCSFWSEIPGMIVVQGT